MKHELAVMIWNEFISQSLNYGCKFSFKDLENRIGEKIEEQENVKKDLFKLFTLWVLVHKRSVFLESDFSKKDKENILNFFGYSSNVLND
jgi:hypothetical protein